MMRTLIHVDQMADAEGIEAMGKLIDADALIKALGITDMNCERCAWYSGIDWNPCKRGSDFEQACFEIENAPEAVVRCKDCKYGEQDEFDHWWCRGFGCQVGNIDGSGFCADGERRTDG